VTKALTSRKLDGAVRRVCRMLDARAAEFNKRDAATGDGDMGSTLQTVARAILADGALFPDDLGEAFGRLAMTFAKTSGSSLSAVLMTGLMSLSRQLAARTESTAAEFVAMMTVALDAMQLRSKAAFGDKTILDGIKAVLAAAEGAESFTELGKRARSAAETALLEFRDRPARIGRARLASHQGVDLDDPGMAVLLEIVAVISGD
jgi:dihydroxyacetone kinase-like protein